MNKDIKEGVGGIPTCMKPDGTTVCDTPTVAASDPAATYDAQQFAANPSITTCPTGCVFDDGTRLSAWGAAGWDTDCATIITSAEKAVNNYSLSYFIDQLTGEEFDEKIHCICETEDLFINTTDNSCSKTFFADHCANHPSGAPWPDGNPRHVITGGGGGCEITPGSPAATNYPGCVMPTTGVDAILKTGYALPETIISNDGSDYIPLPRDQAGTMATCKDASTVAGGASPGYCIPKINAEYTDRDLCAAIDTQVACDDVVPRTCANYIGDQAKCLSIGCEKASENQPTCDGATGTGAAGTSNLANPPSSPDGGACQWIALTDNITPATPRVPYAYCPLETTAHTGGPYEIVGCPLQPTASLGAGGSLIGTPACMAAGGTAVCVDPAYDATAFAANPSTTTCPSPCIIKGGS